jgi:hypothetical protein
MSEYTTKDSGERVEFASGMVRDVDSGKVKFHLVASGPMLRRWAALLTRGAVKYAEDNWLKADGEAERQRFRASAFRHFMQWYYGEDDEDHGAAVFFNINGCEYVSAKMHDDPADDPTTERARVASLCARVNAIPDPDERDVVAPIAEAVQAHITHHDARQKPHARR